MSLFKTTLELKDYIAIDANTSFKTLLPYVKEAEQQFIIPIIGQALFDEINAQYNSVPPTLSADNTSLLPYIQKPLAYYAQLLGLNELSVVFGDMGTRDHNSTDHSSPAPRWKQEKLEMQLLTKGDRQSDILLSYLEAKASASKYPSWFSDISLNTKMSGVIVYNTVIASKYIDINESRRIFLRLKKYIKDVERSIIKKLVGASQYDLLVNQLQTLSSIPLTSTNLLEKLEPIISKRALFIALPLMRIAKGENGGLFIYSGTDDLFKLGQYASELDVKGYQKALQHGDFGYESDEQELKQFIDDNIESYPEIKASTAHTSKAVPGPTYVPINSDDFKHFSV